MPQNLSTIKALLQTWGLRPKHRLGQNFLHDANQMARVVEAANLAPGDLVLEVGAGTGALSLRLLDLGARVVMVELDRDLEAVLRDQLAPYAQQVTLIIADVLAGKHTINPNVVNALQEAHTVQAFQPKDLLNFKLVANLPYHVASPLLANLATCRVESLQMTDAVVMLQREVADRLTATPGGKDYGALGVLIQSMYHVESIGIVGPSCFWPQPKVESTIVRLTRRQHPLTNHPQRLSALLHRVFSQRRKQIGTILGRQITFPDDICPKARPEQLTVEQFAGLADWFMK